MMIEQGMSQADLAKAANLTQGAISKYLSGRQEPKSRELHALAAALNLTMDELYCSGKSYPARVADNNSKWNPRAEDAERKLSALKKGLTELLKEY